MGDSSFWITVTESPFLQSMTALLYGTHAVRRRRTYLSSCNESSVRNALYTFYTLDSPSVQQYHVLSLATSLNEQSLAIEIHKSALNSLSIELNYNHFLELMLTKPACFSSMPCKFLFGFRRSVSKPLLQALLQSILRFHSLTPFSL